MSVQEKDLDTNRGLGKRFEVFGELGEGGEACVLAVNDRLCQLRRAIKLAPDKRFRRRFRAEFRKLAQLRHPNIVRAYDYDETEEGVPYYTMEWVEGVSLGEFPQRGKPEVLAVIAMQILDALSAIHARGWVHRDIKPTNMLIVGEGRGALARIIDMGHMTLAGKPSAVSGTLPYIAPEIARQEICDARSDLYSLGVVLYEALVPEAAALTTEDVIQFRRSLRPPHQLNPSIPIGFSDFIMGLLEEEPSRRFESARIAAAALSRVTELHVGLGPNRLLYERLVRGGAVSHRGRLLEKSRRLTKNLRQEGRGGLVVVDGPIGIGKTPFMRELGMTLSLDGFRVLRFRATKEPGSPILEILEAARSFLVDSETEIEVFRQEAREFGPKTPAQATGKIAALIARSLSERPTALFLDDLQHAERITLEVLRSLSSELKTVPLFVFCAGDPRTDGEDLARALAPDFYQLDLEPLTADEIGDLVANRLCGLEIPPPLLSRIVADSQGMPSLVEKILARLLVEQSIRWVDQKFEFSGGRYQAAKHSEPEYIEKCLGEVSESDLQILWSCAVLGKDLSARHIAKLIESSIREVGAALARLARIGILRSGAATGEPTYLFSSRSFRERAYHSVPIETRRTFHDLAADLIDEEERDGGLHERLEHLFRGSRDELAIDLAIQAGERSADLYADRKAIEYFARAYSRVKGREDFRQKGIALRLGQLFERIGELERASVWYDAALNACSERGVDSVPALLGLGNVAFSRGMSEQAEELVDKAIALLNEADEFSSDFHVVAMRLKALASLKKGKSDECKALLLSALELSQEKFVSEYRGELLLDLARVEFEENQTVSSIRYARKALHLSRKLGRLSVVYDSQIEIARNLLRKGRFRTARRTLLMVLQSVRRSGDRWREAIVLRELGNLRFHLADLTGALKRFNRSLELVRVLRLQSEEALCLHNIGFTNILLGEFRSGLGTLNAALEITTMIGDQAGAAAAYVELGHAHLLLGDDEHARRMIATATQSAEFTEEIALEGQARVLTSFLDICLKQYESWERLKLRRMEFLEAIKSPGQRAHFLSWMVRCAQLVKDPECVQEMWKLLDAEVEEGNLIYYGFVRDILLARGDGNDPQELSTESLIEVAGECSNRALKPLEITSALELGRRHADTDDAVQWLTHALELMRELSRQLGPCEAAHFVQTQQATEIKGIFDKEWSRIKEAGAH